MPNPSIIAMQDEEDAAPTAAFDKQIIVCEGKHGDLYYDATTSEAFQRSALSILTFNHTLGYMYPKPDDAFSDTDYKGNPKFPNVLDKETIKALPTSELISQETHKYNVRARFPVSYTHLTLPTTPYV